MDWRLFWPGLFINQHGNLVAWVGQGDGLRLVAAAHGQIYVSCFNGEWKTVDRFAVLYLKQKLIHIFCHILDTFHIVKELLSLFA